MFGFRYSFHRKFYSIFYFFFFFWQAGRLHSNHSHFIPKYNKTFFIIISSERPSPTENTHFYQHHIEYTKRYFSILFWKLHAMCALRIIHTVIAKQKKQVKLMFIVHAIHFGINDFPSRNPNPKKQTTAIQNSIFDSISFYSMPFSIFAAKNFKF